MNVFFHRDLTGRAVVAQSNGLILPLFEISFLDLLDSYSGSISFVVSIVNWDCFITGNLGFVVFGGGKLLTVTSFSFGNPVAVIGIVVALHNEIFAAALAFAEAYICFQHFRKLQFQNICYSSKLILDIQKMWNGDCCN